MGDRRRHLRQEVEVVGQGRKIEAVEQLLIGAPLRRRDVPTPKRRQQVRSEPAEHDDHQDGDGHRHLRQEVEVVGQGRKIEAVEQLLIGAPLRRRDVPTPKRRQQVRSEPAEHDDHQDGDGHRHGGEHREQSALADGRGHADEGRQHHRVEGVVQTRRADHEDGYDREGIPQEALEGRLGRAEADVQRQAKGQRHAEAQGDGVVIKRAAHQEGRQHGGEPTERGQDWADLQPAQHPVGETVHRQDRRDVDRVHRPERVAREMGRQPHAEPVGPVETGEIEVVAFAGEADLGVEPEPVAVHVALDEGQEVDVVAAQEARLGRIDPEVTGEGQAHHGAYDADRHVQAQRRRRRGQRLQGPSIVVHGALRWVWVRCGLGKRGRQRGPRLRCRRSSASRRSTAAPTALRL